MAARKMQKVKCEHCGAAIPVERLEVLPETTSCVKCAVANPVEVYHEPYEICAQSSPSGQNGWSSKD